MVSVCSVPVAPGLVWSLRETEQRVLCPLLWAGAAPAPEPAVPGTGVQCSGWGSSEEGVAPHEMIALCGLFVTCQKRQGY